jgi:hypothetical protein
MIAKNPSIFRLSILLDVLTALGVIFLGAILYNSMEFVGSSLHMLAFCIGAIMFYFLLFRSSTIPKWLSLWGLLSLMPLLVGTMAMIFGTSIPFIFYVPYVPFELFIGLFILTKGLTPVN